MLEAYPGEHHREIIGKLTKIIMVIFSHFMVKLYSNNTSNILIVFSPLRIGIIKSRFHYFILEARNYKLHDFSVFQPVTGPQNQLYLFLQRPGHLKKIRNKSGNILEAYYFCKYENQTIRFFFFRERLIHMFFLEIRR